MKILVKLISVIFITAICFYKHSYAQNESTSIPVIKGVGFERIASYISYVDGFDDAGNGYATLVEGKSEHHLAQFDASMNQTNYKKLVLDADAKKYTFEHIQLFNNDLFLFTSLVDSKTKRKIIFAQTIDKKTLLPNKDLRQIAEFDISKVMAYVTPVNKTVYFTISKDKSKLAICFMLPNYECISIVLIDAKATVLWKKIVTVKSNADINRFMALEINNAGDVCYLLRSKDPNRILNSGQKHVYYVIGCFNNGTIVKEFPLEIKDKAIKELSLSINESSIFCAGYVCKLDPNNAFGSNKMWGSCFFKIDLTTKSVTAAKYADFDVELFNTKNSDAASKDIENKIEEDKNFLYLDYVTTSIVLNPNGTVYLIGEYQKYTESFSIHGNLLFISFSESGNINWSKQIYKVQQEGSTVPQTFCSYAPIVINNNLYVLYNDYINNLNIPRGTLPEIYKGGNTPSALALIKLDEKGIVTKKTLINNDVDEIFMMPVTFALLPKNELILTGRSRANYQLYKATF